VNLAGSGDDQVQRQMAATRIQQSSRQGCVVLTLAGPLDLAAASRLQRAILKQLAQHPPAIICDLGQVEAIDPQCAGVFTSIRHPALGWPGTALVLCGARRTVADTLDRLRVPQHLATYPSLDQALRNARARPRRLRERLALGPVPTAARASRAFVRRWSCGWSCLVIGCRWRCTTTTRTCCGCWPPGTRPTAGWAC